MMLLLLLCASSCSIRSFAQVMPDTGEADVTNATEQKMQSSTVQKDKGEWVIAAYLGGSHTAASSLAISQPTLGTSLTFGDVRFNGESFKPPFYYGFRGGYFMRGNLSLGGEVGFTHFKVFSDALQRVQAAGIYRGASINQELLLGQIVQQYSISHGVNLLLFNLAGRYQIARSSDHPAGCFIFTGRVGLGPTLPHTESTIDGQHQEQYEVGRLGWQLATEVEVGLWRGLYALGEYKFTRTRQRGKIFAGEAESLLRTHHAVFDLSYHFD